MAESITYYHSADPEEARQHEEDNALYYEAMEKGWSGAKALKDDTFASMTPQRREELWNAGLRPTSNAWEARYGDNELLMMHQFIDYGDVSAERYTDNDKPKSQWTKEEIAEERRARDFHMGGGREPIPYTNKLLSPAEKLYKTKEWFLAGGKERVGKDDPLDLVQGAMRRLPIAGAVAEGIELGHVYAASNRISEGKATDVDYSMVGRYLAYDEMSQNDPLIQSMFKNISHLPAYGMEIAMTGGLSALLKKGGKEAAKKVVKEGVKSAAREGVEQAAKKTIKSRTKDLIKESALHAATTGSPRVINEALAEGTPQLYGDTEGFKISEGNHWALNLPEAFLHQMAEYAVEKGLAPSGKIKDLNKVPPSVFGKIKERLSTAYSKLNVGKNVPVLEKMGFGGLITELGEERVNELVQPIISAAFGDLEDAQQRTGWVGDATTETLYQAGKVESTPEETEARRKRLFEQGLTEVVGLGLMGGMGKVKQIGGRSDRNIVYDKKAKEELKSMEAEIGGSTDEELMDFHNEVAGAESIIELSRLSEKLEKTEDPEEQQAIQEAMNIVRQRFASETIMGFERNRMIEKELNSRGVIRNDKGEWVNENQLELKAPTDAGIYTEEQAPVPTPEEGELTLESIMDMGQEAQPQQQEDVQPEEAVEQQPAQEVALPTEEEVEAAQNDPLELIRVDEQYSNDLEELITEIEGSKNGINSRAAGKKIQRFLDNRGFKGAVDFKSKEGRSNFISSAKSLIEESREVHEQARAKKEADQAKQEEIAQTFGDLINHEGRLKGSPRYGYNAGGVRKNFQLEWEDDVDKAIYIVTGRGTNKRQNDYLAFIKHHYPNVTNEQIAAEGKRLRAEVLKPMAQKSDESSYTVPKFNSLKEEYTPIELDEPEVESQGTEVAPEPKVEPQPKAKEKTPKKEAKQKVTKPKPAEAEAQVKKTEEIEAEEASEETYDQSEAEYEAGLKGRVQAAERGLKVYQEKYDKELAAGKTKKQLSYQKRLINQAKKELDEAKAELSKHESQKAKPTKPEPTETTKPDPTPKTKTPDEFQSQDYEAMELKDLEKETYRLGSLRDSMPEGPARAAVQAEMEKVAEIYNKRAKGKPKKTTPPKAQDPKAGGKKPVPQKTQAKELDLGSEEAPSTVTAANKQIKDLQSFIEEQMKVVKSKAKAMEKEGRTTEDLSEEEGEELDSIVNAINGAKNRLDKLNQIREELDDEARPTKEPEAKAKPKPEPKPKKEKKAKPTDVPEGLTKKGAYYYESEGSSPISRVEVDGKGRYLTWLLDMNGGKNWYEYGDESAAVEAGKGYGEPTRKALVEKLEAKAQREADVEKKAEKVAKEQRPAKATKEELELNEKQFKEIADDIEANYGMKLTFNKRQGVLKITPIAASKQNKAAKYELINGKKSVSLNEPLIEEGESVEQALVRLGDSIEPHIGRRPNAPETTYAIKRERKEKLKDVEKEKLKEGQQLALKSVKAKLVADFMKSGYSKKAAEQLVDENYTDKELSEEAIRAFKDVSLEEAQAKGIDIKSVLLVPDIITSAQGVDADDRTRIARTEYNRIMSDPKHHDAAASGEAIDISKNDMLVLEALLAARHLHYAARYNNYNALTGRRLEDGSLERKSGNITVEQQRKVGKEHRQINAMLYDPNGKRMFSSDGQFVLQWEYDKNKVGGRVYIGTPVTGTNSDLEVRWSEGHAINYTFDQIRATNWTNIPPATDSSDFAGILNDDIDIAKEEYVRWIKDTLGKRMKQGEGHINQIRRSLPWGVLNQEELKDYFGDVIKAFKKERLEKHGTELPPTSDMSMMDMEYLFSPSDAVVITDIKGEEQTGTKEAKARALKFMKKIARGRKVIKTKYGYRVPIGNHGDIHIAFRQEGLAVFTREIAERYPHATAEEKASWVGMRAGGVYFMPKNSDKTFGLNELGMVLVNGGIKNNDVVVANMIHELTHMAEYMGFLDADLVNGLLKKAGWKGGSAIQRSELLASLIEGEYHSRSKQSKWEQIKQAFKDMVTRILNVFGYGEKDADFIYRELVSGRLFNQSAQTRLSRTESPDNPMKLGGSKLLFNVNLEDGTLPSDIVRDTRGKPKLLLHGTPNRFKDFKGSKVGSNTEMIDTMQGDAFFFTDGEALARNVGSYASGKKASLLKRYIRLNNPLEYMGDGRGVGVERMASLIRNAKSLGKDGIIYRTRGDSPTTTYVVFSTDQILIPTSRINEQTVGSKRIRPNRLNARQLEIYEEAEKRAEEIWESEYNTLETELSERAFDEELDLYTDFEYELKQKESNKSEEIELIINDLLESAVVNKDDSLAMLKKLGKYDKVPFYDVPKVARELGLNIMLNDMPDIEMDGDYKGFLEDSIKKEARESRGFIPEPHQLYSPPDVQSMKSEEEADRPDQLASNVQYAVNRAVVNDEALKSNARNAVLRDLEAAYKEAVDIMQGRKKLTINNAFLIPAVLNALYKKARESGDASDIVRRERYDRLQQIFGSELSAAMRSRRDPIQTEAEKRENWIRKLLEGVTDEDQQALEEGLGYDTSKDTPREGGAALEIETVEPVIDEEGGFANPVPKPNSDSVSVLGEETTQDSRATGGAGGSTGTGTGEGSGAGSGTGKGSGSGTGKGAEGKGTGRGAGKKANNAKVQKVIDTLSDRRSKLHKYLKSKGFDISDRGIARMSQNPAESAKLFNAVKAFYLTNSQKGYSWAKAYVYFSLLSGPRTFVTNATSGVFVNKAMRLEKMLGRNLFFELPRKITKKVGGKIDKSIDTRDVRKFREILKDNPELADYINTGLKYAFIQGMQDSNSMVGKLLHGSHAVFKQWKKEKGLSAEIAAKTLKDGIGHLDLKHRGFDKEEINFHELENYGGTVPVPSRPQIENEILLALRADDIILALQHSILLPTRVMMATDDFIRNEEARRVVGFVAAGIARNAVENGTLAEKDVDSYIMRLVMDERSEAWKAALTHSKNAMFQTTEQFTMDTEEKPTQTFAGWVGEQGKNLQKSVLLDSLVTINVPFKMTPTNIMIELIARTPITGAGILVYRMNQNRKAGKHPFNGIEGAAFTNLILSSLVMSALIGSGDDDDEEYIGTKNFNIAGAVPTDWKERKFQYVSPTKGGTVTLFGHTWDVNELSPYLPAANLATEFHLRLKKEGVGSALASSVKETLSLAYTQPHLRVVQDIGDMAEGKKTFTGYVMDKGGMLVPNIIKQPLREGRSYVAHGEEDTTLETLASKAVLPDMVRGVMGLDETQPIINPYGEVADNEFADGDVKKKMDITATTMNLLVPMTRYRGERKDFIGYELYENWNKKSGVDKSYPREALGGHKSRTWKDPRKGQIKLTRPEYTKFAMSSGEIARTVTEAAISKISAANPTQLDVDIANQIFTYSSDFVKQHYVRNEGDLDHVDINHGVQNVMGRLRGYVGRKSNAKLTEEERKSKERFYNGGR